MNTQGSERAEVVIAGAGPAGMVLAYLLASRGIWVRVLERHQDFRREFRGEGIQPSVMALLEELGFLPYLLESGIAVRAHRAVIYDEGRPAVTLGGLDDEEKGDFGLVVFQEGFLSYLHQRCSAFPNYRLDFGTTVTRPVFEEGRVTALMATQRGGEVRVEGNLIVATLGRGSPLRKQVGAEVDVLESAFNIYWLKLDAPADPDLVPDGFKAYLGDDALFIFYRSYDGRIQVAWGKRWNDLSAVRDIDILRERLLADVPVPYRAMVAQLNERTERQFLKVACDRLRRWHVPGLLFLGDAAHTMSPVAGQGINLAIRDSVVAANHLIAAKLAGRPWDEALCQAIEDERRPEVEAMQSFQVQLGRLMLGAPRWQRRLVFRYLMPVLNVTGIRRWLVRRVQGGVTRVAPRYVAPSAWGAFAATPGGPAAP